MVRSLLGRLVGSFLVLQVVLGCGGPADDAATQGLPTQEAALTDLSGLLESLAQQKKKPPLKLVDLEKYEPIHMAACLGVSSNKIEYVWGQGLVADGQSIIAYDAKAPSEGGFVLFQSGVIKQLSAAEFGSAPKASKK